MAKKKNDNDDVSIKERRSNYFGNSEENIPLVKHTVEYLEDIGLKNGI